MKPNTKNKQRFQKISKLPEEISMSKSGGDVKWVNPVVIAVIEAVVVTGT